MSALKESVVVKLGAECVADLETTPTGTIAVGTDPERLEACATNIAILAHTFNVKLTCSGAVARGRQIAKKDGLDYINMDLQVAAGIGSGALVEDWREPFRRHHLTVVQGLVTNHELEQKEQEGSNLAEACRLMDQYPVIPIFNQNDLLIQKGECGDELVKLKSNEDNDWLAVDLAWRIGARAVVLCMSERDGFEIHGEVQREVKATDIESLIAEHVQPSFDGAVEKPGMKSKLRACGWAALNGVDAYMCNVSADLFNVVTGREISTRVVQ